MTSVAVANSKGNKVDEGMLSRRFDAIAFDWDGTAVTDRHTDASRVRDVIEGLCATGCDVYVVTGTNITNVDGQLRARPHGPGKLMMCLNRGSEVFDVGSEGPKLVHRRVATPAEDSALDAAAHRTIEMLSERGLRTEIVAQRLNRRKIDLIPEPEWVDPCKARIAELLAAVEDRLHAAGIASLGEAVEISERASAEVGLPDPRVTSDAKYIEIGLTDKSDSAQWLYADLWRRGVGPGLVLIGGDEFGSLGGLPGSDSFLMVPEGERSVLASVGNEPNGVPDGVLALHGGPARFVQLLEHQLKLRRTGAVPSVDADPEWSVEIDGFEPEREAIRETLLTMADGDLGTRGTLLGANAGSTPYVVHQGVYCGTDGNQHLMACPVWNLLPFELSDEEAADGRMRRLLDMRTGVVRHELTLSDGTVEAVEFASMARPATVGLRARGPHTVVRPGTPLVPPVDPDDVATSGPLAVNEVPPKYEDGRDEEVSWGRVAAGDTGHTVTAAAVEAFGEREPGEASLDRVAVYEVGDSIENAVGRVRDLQASGFDALLRQQREVWAARWDDTDIVIEGDPELQRAIRFSLYHMMSSVASQGDAALGARGISGVSYHGHVFWDADVFCLPMMAATHPKAARAMLEYRLRRLDTARTYAAATGAAGARFPWESAATGADVTPKAAVDPKGTTIPIRTGELEHHIAADVAWAAVCYKEWSGDAAWASGPMRTLLIETARYWASHARLDSSGEAHIDHVIGPDEYHEDVNDNAFTNVMARWNLRKAATLAAAVPGLVDPEESRRWIDIADALAVHYNSHTKIYEQFNGYHELEPLTMADVAPKRPVPADVILGYERVRRSQILKQADVLMLHLLVPEDMAPGSLEPNLDYYEPKTAHGSSLSPAMHAALFARAGRMDEALDMLKMAAYFDFHDLQGSSSKGLHMATMGGVWLALVYGFLGARPHGDVLMLDPRKPSEWHALEVNLRFRGGKLRIRVEKAHVILTADTPVTVQFAGTEPVIVPPSVGVIAMHDPESGDEWIVGYGRR